MMFPKISEICICILWGFINSVSVTYIQIYVTYIQINVFITSKRSEVNELASIYGSHQRHSNSFKIFETKMKNKISNQFKNNWII